MKMLVNVELIKALFPFIWPLLFAGFWFHYRHEIRAFIAALGSFVVAISKNPDKINSIELLGAKLGLAQTAATPPALPTAAPDAKAIEASTSTNLPALESGPTIPTSEDEDDTSNNWIFCLFAAQSDEDLQKAEELYRKEQEAETDGSEKMLNEARYLYAMYSRGDTNALEKLHVLVQKPGPSAQMFRLVGLSYQFGRNFDKSV